MAAAQEDRKLARTQEVAALIAAKHSDAPKEITAPLLARYFTDVDVDDLLARDAATWAAIAGNHLRFAHEFQSGAPKMRIFTPREDEHGWSAACTAIEFVNNDMPFLVDSIAMELNRQGLSIRQIIHPIYDASRDAHGTLTGLNDPRDGEHLESWIHIEIERVTDPVRIKQLGDGLVAILGDVRAAVSDWSTMRGKVNDILADMSNAAKVVPLNEIDEARAFLTWMADNHFTFLGYREYELATMEGQDVLKIVPHSGLGVLREPKLGGVSASFRDLPKDLRALARKPTLLALTKANSRATVHRAGYLDYVGVKRFDANGNVIGERRLIGLYTSSSYHADPRDIPLLRQKVARLAERAGFPPGSHAAKNLMSIIDGFPRDELFQIGDDELFNTVMGILQLGERARTKLFLRRDIYARFYSCLIYLPRENYNTDTRIKLQDLLKARLAGTSAEFNVQLTESALARIHMLVRTAPTSTGSVDVKALEAEIVELTRRWEDGVFAQLVATGGEDLANAARREFVLPLPATYQAEVSVDQAIADFRAARLLTTAEPLALSLLPGKEAASLRFRVLHLGQPITLSNSLPMLENMGVRVENERSYVIARHSAQSIFVHDFGLTRRFTDVPLEQVRAKFETAFLRVWKRETESDGFNRLTLAAGLASDEIVVLRALAKYLKQTGFNFSQTYIEQTLAGHSAISRALVALFHARFDPALGAADSADRTQKAQTQIASIEAALEDVAIADEDRILRRILAVMLACLRTNFYQRKDGQRKEYVSFKIKSALVPELPDPKPLFEIFVYSPRIEGIHLRFGKVARGGLRWSDRQEDFRTEVLGLVKAQQVKNAVIVPVGSKGGFVLKAAPPQSDREAYMAEGVACYKNFLRGLLDVTDNLIKGAVVAPANVVRHDADDPYLVVAADKGTATFSDYANAISAEYGHWLGDAFASGGSAGYDHKKMGITARGAWESVKRHFREMDLNTQTTDFTVVGVGDMSGDVFGNGMLLSKHIRLLAAFDHRHFFLDPSPDASTSFKERERMFALPRSSWDDYDKTLISKGGGVYPRGAKSIPLSPEIRTVLGVEASVEAMTPQELMRAILRAPVDLFYNGGIGTYIKASTQSNSEVGDKANDAIRVNGNELRCKVVAEGGNLGATQLGRIEAAMAGVRILTDAIDNSAGVDCSDHEVNIKILLGAAMDAGLLSDADRNPLLAEMTEEVGHLVLRDNYFQTQSLSVSGVRSERLVDAQMRFMRHQEKLGRLNRAVEFLPTDEALQERKENKQGLTAPERAVLLAYSKMELYDDLLASDLIDDEYVARALVGYFPTALQTRFASVMGRHPLKREIIATDIANSTINRTGSVFINRMRDETGASAPEIVRAYVLTRDIFGIGDTWAGIDALDNLTPTATQNEMLIEVGRLVLRSTLWFLRRRGERMPIADVLAFFQPGVESVSTKLPELLSSTDLQALAGTEERLTELGAPPALAARVARSDALYAVLDIVEIANARDRAVDLAAAVYFSLVGRLGLRWVSAQATALPADTQWQSMARAAVRDDVANLQRLLTESVLALSPKLTTAQALIGAWETHHAKSLARMREVMDDLRGARETDLAMLSVLLRELRVLT